MASDSIGQTIYSGVGGQVDFLRGASLNPNGKPILAFPSRTHKGIARIVPNLKAGAGVVTARALAHYVVTGNKRRSARRLHCRQPLCACRSPSNYHRSAVL